jgi:type II secretion system protein J
MKLNSPKNERVCLVAADGRRRIRLTAGRSASSRRRRHGFTLIELILAIGVAAIVLVAVNAVFFGALHLRTATTEVVEEAIPLDSALATLRRDLRCAVPPTPNGMLCGDFKAGDFTSYGVVDMVNLEIFTATGALSADPAKPWADIQRVTYGLKSSVPGTTAGKSLTRTVTRNLLSDLTPEIEEQSLLAGVQSFSVECFDGLQWYDQWDTTSTSTVNTNLPLAVRVRIQMTGKGSTPLQPIELFVPIDSQSRTNA